MVFALSRLVPSLAEAVRNGKPPNQHKQKEKKQEHQNQHQQQQADTTQSTDSYTGADAEGHGQSQGHSTRRHMLGQLTKGRRALSSARSKLRNSKHFEGLSNRLSMMRPSRPDSDLDDDVFHFDSELTRSDNSTPSAEEVAASVISDKSNNPPAFAAANCSQQDQSQSPTPLHTPSAHEDAESMDETLTLASRSDDEVGKSSSSASSARPRPAGRSGFLDLPQELFDAITSYLGSANIVVLALVNKELFARFQHYAIPALQNSPNAASTATTTDGAPDENESLQDSAPNWKILGDYIKTVDTIKSKARGTLLSLLDVDLVDLVYCYKCKKMHNPWITFQDRAYVPWKSYRCTDYAESHRMPPRATRKLLRTINKRRKNKKPYLEFMRQVNNTSTTYRNGVMVQVALRMRYRGDNLLLRRQQVVSSIDKTSLALYLFRKQLRDEPSASYNTSLSNPKVHRVCNHFTWSDRYSVLLDQLVDPLCKSEHEDLEPVAHKPSCFSSAEPYNPASISANPIAQRLQKLDGFPPKPSSPNAASECLSPAPCLGDIRGCQKCTTDYSFDVVRLPAPFHWGFVLTTWLDLGPADFCQKWDSHRDPRAGRIYERKMPERAGDICARFESVPLPPIPLPPTSSTNADGETEENKPAIEPLPWVEPIDMDYQPIISDLNLERMQNYGWAQHAENGKGRYLGWSLAHMADPATGKLRDPDPLEPEDLSD